MTLYTGISRARRYALMSCDSGAYTGAEDGLAPIAVPNKVIAITDYVLMANSRCAGLAVDFRRLLAEQLTRADDLDITLDAARAAVGRLQELGLEGEPYQLGGKTWRRGSVDRDFVFALCGYRRDGSTGIAQYGDGTFEGIYEQPDFLEWTVGVPWGVDVALVEPSCAFASCLELPEAWHHVYGLHRYLGLEREERVSSDVNVQALIWRGHGIPPLRLDFAVDSQDDDAFASTYSALETILAELEVPGPLDRSLANERAPAPPQPPA